MPFALMNSRDAFHLALDTFLSSYKCKTCQFYENDIIIFLEDSKSHLRNFEQIIFALNGANVTIKLINFSLFTQKVL